MAKQKLEFELTGNIKDFTSNINAAKGNLKKLSSAVKESLASLPGGNKLTEELKAAKREAQTLLRELKKLQDAKKTSLSEATPKQRARITGLELGYKDALGSAKPSAIELTNKKALTEQEKKLTAERKQEEYATRAANRESANAASHAITLRYALYDVSSTIRVAAQGMMMFASASIQAQIAQEAAFAQIQKTQVGTGATTKEVTDLKNQLIALSTSIPVSFAELTKIGTLGAQLGINAKDIAAFTEVTAKFSAITGMSAEQSAMGFGKIANLLGLSGEQFASLGSAIAKVGVTSAATEQQIINTAGQIGAIAKAAGFTASEIIGLSSAMASLKIAPEEARGVLIPTFHAMDAAARSFSKSIGSGSESLAIFASISGMSQEEFASQWGDKSSGSAGAVWKNFVTGLGNTDISASLAKLNLDGIRTSKGLTALGSNAAAVFKQIADASAAGIDGQFLKDAASPVFETLSAKLQMLQNSFENLNAAASSNPAFVASIGLFVDTAKNLNVILTRLFNKNQFMSGIAAITVAVVGLTGLFASLLAGTVAAGAGMLALKTAFVNASAAGINTSTGLVGIIRGLLGVPGPAVAASAALRGVAAAETTVGTGAVVASTGINTLKWSIRGLLASTGIGLLLVAIGAVAEGLFGVADSTDPTVKKLDDLANKSNKTAEEVQSLADELVALVNASSSQVGKLANVEEAVYNLGKGMKDAKNDFSIYTEAGRTNLQNLNAAMVAIAGMSNSPQELANNLLAMKNAMIAAGISSVDALGAIDSAIANTQKNAIASTYNFTNSLISGFKSISTSAGTTKTALEKLDEVLQKVFRSYNAKLGIMDAFDSLGKSMGENGKIFGYETEGMRDNLKSLEDVISAFKDTSNGDLAVFRGNLLSLRAAMQKLGVTSGPALSLINAALAKTGTKGKASAKEIAAIFNTIGASIKKNSQTISDYVGDLSKALSDAFSNRYGKQEAMDKITSSFNEMKAAAAEASAAIADAQKEIAGIRADKGILEYQLSVAVRYGDTLRAEAIRAKLAKANADLATQEAKITENQQTLNKTLVGTTASAIENRSKLRELVQSGNAYLLTLAQSGMSTADLQIEAKKLADEFKQQGLNLGFAESELQVYLTAFTTDFTTVVKNVPRDVTIEVSTDPALEAVKKFVADTNTALLGINMPSINVSTSGTGTGTSGSGNKLPTTTTTTPPAATVKIPSGMSTTLQNATPTQDALLKYRNAKQVIQTYESGWGGWFGYFDISAERKIVADFIKLFGNGYASGGLVSGSGTSTSDSIPARLSSGEYVIQANAVRHYGADFMNALNNVQVQRQSYAGNNSGSNGMVYLSPEDRQLLRAAIERPINLYADSKQIASTASNGNVSLARRGLN